MRISRKEAVEEGGGEKLRKKPYGQGRQLLYLPPNLGPEHVAKANTDVAMYLGRHWQHLTNRQSLRALCVLMPQQE